MPISAVGSHGFQKLLSGVEERTLPDYPSVIALAQDRSCASRPVWLTTLNTAIARAMVRSEGLEPTNSDYFCIDGFPLLVLLRRFLPADVSRTTGVDLVSYVCNALPTDSGPILFVGEQESIATASLRVLADRTGRSDLLHFSVKQGWQPSDPVDSGERLFLGALQPGVVFVCLGFPKQWLWFNARRSWLPAGLYIGAGSALRVAGGFSSRMPRWLRDRGFEWLGRLLQEPRRLAPRYAADLFFLARVAMVSVHPGARRRGGKP